jgi:hypothetical protein
MSISEAITKRYRRAFSPEFKAEVVALCHQLGKSVARVARELEVPRRPSRAGRAKPKVGPGQWTGVVWTAWFGTYRLEMIEARSCQGIAQLQARTLM